MLSLDPKVFRKSHTEDDFNFAVKSHKKCSFLHQPNVLTFIVTIVLFSVLRTKKGQKCSNWSGELLFLLRCPILLHLLCIISVYIFLNFFPFFQGYCSLLSMFADGKQRGTLFSFVQTSNIREISKSVEVQ